MNSLIRSLSTLIIAISGMLISASANAQILFQNNFDTGLLGKPFTGGSPNVTVSTNRSKSGSYSVEFYYHGKPDLAADSTAQLNFDLGALHTDIWIQYQLYIPSNYYHRDGDPVGGGGDNNKFLRMWGSSYNDQDKIGFSTLPLSGGESRLESNWAATGFPAIGHHGSSPLIFGSSDLGKWMTIRIQVKAATSTQNGSLNVWKNGKQIIDNTNKMDNYKTGYTHAYRYGYLLGWANSGFTNDTVLYIDDIVFATSASDLGAGPAAPNPPSNVQ